MNTIQLQENVSFETYQKIVNFIHGLGVKIKNETPVITNPYELTEDDFIALAKSDEDIKAGRLVDSSDVQNRARALCLK